MCLIYYLLSYKFLKWFFRKGYPQGIFWTVFACLISVINDIFMRYLGDRLPVIEIIFFRFFISLMILFPFFFMQKLNNFKTSKPGLHLLRVILGILGIGCSCYSVISIPLVEYTTLMFTQPLFFFFLAILFFKERPDAFRWIATLGGFLGIIIMNQPQRGIFQVPILYPLLAAFFFALLDVIAKKMLASEKILSMLFYFSLGSTLLTCLPTFFLWETPTIIELLYLIFLGIGANLIQIGFIFAFSCTEASGLMPFRYLEFIFSSLMSFILFSETLHFLGFLGSFLIIISTFLLSYHEAQKEKNRKVPT